MNRLALEELVRRALTEDIGPIDITTEATVPEDWEAVAVVYAKENGVFCGHAVAELVFSLLDPHLTYARLVEEGADVAAGEPVARVVGKARAVLSGERVTLNLIQRMSGIATITRRLSERIKYYKARLVETRKTAPGLRLVDKYAVRVGGGGSHRYALFDAVLIKDNHIAIAGGIRQAITAARRAAPFTSKVEVEVRNLDELSAALEAGADIIMLDNMDPEDIREAVQLVEGRSILEASGRINESNLEDVAKTGVDFISMGALTHSVQALDVSLEVIGAGPPGQAAAKEASAGNPSTVPSGTEGPALPHQPQPTDSSSTEVPGAGREEAGA